MDNCSLMNGEGGCGGVDAKIKFNLNNVIMIKGHIIFVFNMLILISNAVGQFLIDSMGHYPHRKG